MSPPAEAFLDELVTWRELGYNFCWQRDDHDRYESLPAWARKTLDEHTADPRPHAYALDDLEHARTHDPLWNAAQTQLVREGTHPQLPAHVVGQEDPRVVRRRTRRSRR